MARPIRETPILTGDDALRFEQEMKCVESMPNSERRQNRINLERSCHSFVSQLTVLI